MDDPSAPADVAALAEERALARRERDWPRADELKARIEAAGWKVVDDGPAWSLHRATAPDLTIDGERYHGSADSVPSRLELLRSEPP